ncbi:tyrosine-type recombinase/integrase [Thermodesulfobacteriota bacterium]
MAVRRFRDKWMADVFRGGQRHRKVFDTKKFAEGWEGKIKTAHIEGKLFDVKREAFETFADMMDWFLELPEVKRKKSYDKDKQRSEQLKAFFGALAPVSITPEKIQKYIELRLNTVNCRGNTNKPATVNREMALFKTVFSKAYRNGKTHSNPTKAVSKLKGEEQRDRVLSDEEWSAYYEAAPDWYKPIALCAYVTGMREGEILRLTWDRIDRKAGFIRLRAEDTKTSESRPIPIDPRLGEILGALPRPIQKDGLVFTRNGKPIHSTRYAHQGACKNAGIEDFWFHDFRHTAITNWRRKGADYLTIMRATGHKTLAMFQRYNTVDEEDLKKLIDQASISPSVSKGKDVPLGNSSARA